MKKSLEEYRKGDWYEDEEGCFYDDATNLLQTGILGSCCCGDPEENLAYILKGLELIHQNRPREEKIRHFGNEASAEFFYYWADNQGFTEHGTIIPGWLTENGEALLGLLRERIGDPS